MTQPTQTTNPKFTKFEKARIIGSRALQISQGAPFMVKLSEDDLKRLKYNPVEIAKMEFESGVLPIEVKRPVLNKREDKKKEHKE